MSETENTTTQTTTMPLCVCGERSSAVDGYCDVCYAEGEEALAIMLQDLDNDDWHPVAYREYDDDPYDGWADLAEYPW